MAEVLPNLLKAIEFHKVSPNGLIKAMNSQKVTLSPASDTLGQNSMSRETQSSFQSGQRLLYTPQVYYIMEFLDRFHQLSPLGSKRMALASDPSPLGDLPFFGYSNKQGYMNLRGSSKVPIIHSFIQ